MSPPIDPALRTPQADVEDRMGIVPLEELLSERDALVRQVAPLRAKHGPFGTWDDLRRIYRAAQAQKIRAQALLDGKKTTEGAVEDAANSEDGYVAFVAQGTSEKAEWAILENRIQGINDQINRGQAIARFLSAEIGLQR